MKPILEIHNLSKKFRIYHEMLPYETLRGKLMNPMRLFKSKKAEEFWALKDVNFNIYPGESVAIIGKNGAGKSTLLKILSKITPPTSGKIIGRGRIASLLEVGTGFHPELSGRENIFLNGSILGMKRKEIVAQFDAIVDFAGVEMFLDTQLKHYSSGMQLRLAFAVAAFLNPEVMVIDEVLAVGDAEFQKKCIGKMESVAQSGRTIIFVSHQMGLVNQLCPRSILLNKGEVMIDDKTSTVTSHYLSEQFQNNESHFKAAATATSKEIYIEEAYTLDASNAAKSVFGYDEIPGIYIAARSNRSISDEVLSMALLDKYGNRVFTVHKPLRELKSGENKFNGIMRIPSEIIAPNFYSYHFAIVKTDGHVFDIHEGQCRMRIADTGTPFSQYEGKEYGNIILDCSWEQPA